MVALVMTLTFQIFS